MHACHCSCVCSRSTENERVAANNRQSHPEVLPLPGQVQLRANQISGDVKLIHTCKLKHKASLAMPMNILELVQSKCRVSV